MIDEDVALRVATDSSRLRTWSISGLRQVLGVTLPAQVNISSAKVGVRAYSRQCVASCWSDKLSSGEVRRPWCILSSIFREMKLGREGGEAREYTRRMAKSLLCSIQHPAMLDSAILSASAFNYTNSRKHLDLA